MVGDSYLKEVARKIVHIFALAYLLGYLFIASRFGHQAGLLLLVLILILMILCEYIRLELKWKVPGLSLIYALRRDHEQDAVGAEIFFITGVIIALAVYDLSIALAAVGITVFGDMTAALIGKRFGRVRPACLGGKKSIEGMLAALLVNLLVGWLVLSYGAGHSCWWQSLGQAELGDLARATLEGVAVWPVIVAMALAGALTEFLISKVDDNLTIPVIAGFAGQIVLILSRL